MKKVLSIILVLTFIVSMIPPLGIPASAATNTVAAESYAEISVEQSWGKPGETAVVQIVLADNPGILGAVITVSWDENLTLMSDASGEAFAYMSYTSPGRYISGGTNFVWYANSVNEAVDGTILTLTFKVSETAENNEILPVRVTYTLGDVIDKDDNDVVLTITDGCVRVLTYLPGDVNGDGRITTRDLVRLSQYISDGCKTDPESYNAEVVVDACDVNSDGKITARDLIKLSQYISDGCATRPDSYNAVLKPAKMPGCSHSDLQEVPEKKATCTEDGNTEYWYCACGKYFADAEGATEIESSDTILEAKGHTALTMTEAKSATCTEDGNTEYWYCSSCEKYFSDAEATNEIDLIATKVEAVGHSPSAEATCTEDQICIMCRAPLASALGHVLIKNDAKEPTYTESGNIEYWQCNVCDKLFSDPNGINSIELNDTILAPKRCYQIQYDLYDSNSTYLATVGVENPNQAYYDPELGLVLMDLAAEGYTFKGWYDDNGVRVREIKEGQTGLMGLNARWEPKTYILTMRDLSTGSKSIEFTPESSFELENPVWRHLAFAKWDDQSGQLVDFIDATGVSRLRLEQGTIGNIEVVAKWRNPINQVVNNTSADTLIGAEYDTASQMYWFVFEIGKIEKVMLGSKEDYKAQYHSGSETTLTYTEQVSITEEKGSSISELSASTVSKSSEWGTARDEILTLSENLGMSVKTGIEAEAKIEGIANVKKSIEFETSIDFGVEESLGIQHSQKEGETITDERSQEICNTFVYAKTVEYSETDSRKLTSEDPVGYYRNINAATVTIYAVVIYDPSTMTCYLETYSVISDIYLYPLYEREGYVDYENDSISYAVDVETIKEKITAAYYIQYDANNGDEKMPIQLACKDELIMLKDDFAKTGYTLAGWTYVDCNGVEQQLICVGGQVANVTNLTDVGKTVTLKAVWAKNRYTVSYNANGGTGNTDATTHMYDTNQTLRANEFLKTGYTFLGWGKNKDSKTPDYTDQQEVINLTSEAGGEFPLFAIWKANTYTIVYDGNGSTSGSTAKSDHTYDVSKKLSANGYKRTGYKFIGWSTDKNAVIPTYDDQALLKDNLATSGSVTLYAIWLKVEAEVVISNRTSDPITSESGAFNETYHPGLDRDTLLKYGYKSLEITFHVYGRGEEGVFQVYDDPYVAVYSYTDVHLATLSLGDYPIGEWAEHYKDCTISLNDVQWDGSFWVKFGNTKKYDHWQCGTVEVYITAVK